jgi:hypothetical protein
LGFRKKDTLDDFQGALALHTPLLLGHEALGMSLKKEMKRFKMETS